VISQKYILKQTKYWRVRIRYDEETYTKNFNYRKHGGVDEAFDVAVRYREYILRQIGQLGALHSRHQSRGKPTTICVGVYLSTKVISGRKQLYWTAHGCRDNIEVKRHFNIKKYGHKQAFIEACKIRYESNGTIIILNEVTIPCLPTVPYKIYRISI
jgi:hypothetical protein